MDQKRHNMGRLGRFSAAECGICFHTAIMQPVNFCAAPTTFKKMFVVGRNVFLLKQCLIPSWHQIDAALYTLSLSRVPLCSVQSDISVSRRCSLNPGASIESHRTLHFTSHSPCFRTKQGKLPSALLNAPPSSRENQTLHNWRCRLRPRGDPPDRRGREALAGFSQPLLKADCFVTEHQTDLITDRWSLRWGGEQPERCSGTG